MIDSADTLTKMLDVTTDTPIRLCFKSANRMYVVALVQDLFQDWVLMQSWGGRFSQRGGGKIHAVATREEGIVQLQRVARQRFAHGYASVDRIQ